MLCGREGVVDHLFPHYLHHAFNAYGSRCDVKHNRHHSRTGVLLEIMNPPITAIPDLAPATGTTRRFERFGEPSTAHCGTWHSWLIRV